MSLTREELQQQNERFRKALQFYADKDNYFSAPLDMQASLDWRTLKAVRHAGKVNAVLVDFGMTARYALAWADSMEIK